MNSLEGHSKVPAAKGSIEFSLRSSDISSPNVAKKKGVVIRDETNTSAILAPSAIPVTGTAIILLLEKREQLQLAIVGSMPSFDECLADSRSG
jgi:hypothetical protein